MAQNTAMQSGLEDAMALIECLELPYLEALQHRLAKHIAQRRIDDMAAAREQIRKIAAGVGMSIDQIMNSAKGAKVPSSYPVKYRHPDGRVWSGQGRQPNWMKVENPEQYRVPT